MSDFHSDLVSYHDRNPDPEWGVCRNTNEPDTDGVVFNYIEPMEGTVCFVGRQSIVEAVAVLFSTTPAQVLKMETAVKDLAACKRENARLQKEAAKFQAFIDKAEDAGIIIPLMKD